LATAAILWQGECVRMSLQRRNMQIMDMTDLLGMLHPLHVHMQVAGNNRRQIGLRNPIGKTRMGDALVGVFRVTPGLGASIPALPSYYFSYFCPLSLACFKFVCFKTASMENAQIPWSS